MLRGGSFKDDVWIKTTRLLLIISCWRLTIGLLICGDVLEPPTLEAAPNRISKSVLWCGAHKRLPAIDVAGAGRRQLTLRVVAIIAIVSIVDRAPGAVLNANRWLHCGECLRLRIEGKRYLLGWCGQMDKLTAAGWLHTALVADRS